MTNVKSIKAHEVRVWAEKTLGMELQPWQVDVLHTLMVAKERGNSLVINVDGLRCFRRHRYNQPNRAT